MQDKSSGSARARKLLEIYRGEVDDFFKLWPPDKCYFFSSDNKAFISYGVNHNVAICMGDPVGYHYSINLLLDEFKQYCLDHGWTLAFIQSTFKNKGVYNAIGLRSILIGADAVIDLDRFTQTTIHNKYFRNLVNRFEKNQFKFEVYSPPHSPKLLNELRLISNSWLKLPHRKEWSFLTGRFDVDYLQQVVLYVVRDSQGKAQAFANDLPSFKPGIVTIDLMRHRADAPANSMDFLFIRLLQTKAQEGYKGFNLGLSPLGGKLFATGLSARLLIYGYQFSNSFIGFRGLHQFKSKYKPKWEPRYVWFQDGRHHLLPIGLAVLSLLRGS